METTKWGVLYCPKTGISNKRKRWEKIQRVLDERGVDYDFVQSETADSVERLMKMMISNGYKTIIIVGGDSALNDAANCLMMEEKEVRESIAQHRSDCRLVGETPYPSGGPRLYPIYECQG